MELGATERGGGGGVVSLVHPDNCLDFLFSRANQGMRTKGI